jgi:DnaJ-class molecular chaperone
MANPHKCPVCNGSGKQAVALSYSTIVDCHACKGTGIVWEPETLHAEKRAGDELKK